MYVVCMYVCTYTKKNLDIQNKDRLIRESNLNVQLCEPNLKQEQKFVWISTSNLVGGNRTWDIKRNTLQGSKCVLIYTPIIYTFLHEFESIVTCILGM